jgi:negative regulator of sigma E activity
MSTNKRKEKISAFLDNEMFRDELMSFSLSSESEDAGVVKRYQMMGDSLRGEMSDSSFIDVSQAVREALLDENPAVESPAVENHAESTSMTTNSKTGSFTLSAWFRPVAGMAVAASVALVMVVTLSGQENVTPIAKNIEQQPAAMPAVQLAIENKSVDKKATDIDPRLVNQHLEFATQDTLQGRLPYVRAVSYQTENKQAK